MSRPVLLLEEVFVTEGVPEFTFVEPPNYNEIFLDIRRAGKPVVIEGQSGTGKTTCVRTILAHLGGDLATQYLSARNAAHVSRIEQIVTNYSPGRFVIDDFHRLSVDLQSKLADVAKIAAEAGSAAQVPKLVIIGINQVGSGLIQLVPDIAKRTGIHRIRSGAPEDISHLINNGCERLNIRIRDAEMIYDETKGDYWLTQQVCQSICASNNVIETVSASVPLDISFDMLDIRRRVVDKLQNEYYSTVKEFCRGRRFRPTNDPYFKLLRQVAEQQASIVDLNELANAVPGVRGSVNNIKDHRLAVLIESKPIVARYFYYNNDTKTLAIEDPALCYFVKHLDWSKLRQDCGFREGGAGHEFEVALSFAGENRELGSKPNKSVEVRIGY